MSDTGDAGAAASVTRDRRASGKYSSTATRGQAAAPGRCSCSGAASLQWQWPSPLVPSCRLQCCTTNSKQQRPGQAGSVAKSSLFSHHQQQNLIHTLKWNIFFFFSDGITGCLLGPGITTLHHQPYSLMSHIMPGIIHLQVCKPCHHLKQEKRMERARLMDSVITGPEGFTLNSEQLNSFKNIPIIFREGMKYSSVLNGN